MNRRRDSSPGRALLRLALRFPALVTIAPRTRLLLAIPAGLAALGVVAASGPLHAQSARSLVEEGNRLYDEGRFQEAHERYMEAMAADPESPVIPYNAGNALYQGADYRRAMEAYEEAIGAGDPELASDAWYNLGNALYRQQQLGPSLEAYKQALRLDPGDLDAKHNLEQVLQQMQRQQQSQESPQDQDQNEEGDQQPQGGQQDQQQPRDGQRQQRAPSGQGQQEDDPGEEGPQGQQPAPSQREREGQEPEAQGDRQPDRAPEGEGQGGGQPRPDEMTEEEARRLLSAIDEDPAEVNRRPASSRGRRPSKPW